MNDQSMNKREWSVDSFSLYKKLLMSKFNLIKEGCIQFIDVNENSNDNKYDSKIGNENSSLNVKLKIRRPCAYQKILFGGSIGAAESFFEGDWECNDLTTLMRILVRNRAQLNQLESGFGSLTKPLLKMTHYFRKNSLSGSLQNIRAHYDLGNDFFKLFLDENLLYSSAYFLSKEKTLEEAQIEKMDRICRTLNLKKEDRLIEIGTGWCGFAIHAVKNYGCHVTTTTLSEQQYLYAVERVKKLKLEDKITVLKKDYRLLDGEFDKLVSIEMIEAVGLNFLETYFEKCNSLLKENGEMLLQSITIRDEYYMYAKKNVDFIQRYIFPGSGIPSISAIMSAVSKKTNLKLDRLEDFGEHYAKTLRHWSEKLTQNKSHLNPDLYSNEFYKCWKYYFSYCEAGFLEKSIGVCQMHFTKPKAIRHLLVDRG